MFVNREVELKKISEALRDINNSVKLKKPIIEFHGVAGIGITSLFNRVEMLATELNISHLYVDFDNAGESHLKNDITHEFDSNLNLSALKSGLTNFLEYNNKGVVILDHFHRADEDTANWLENLLPDILSTKDILILVGSHWSINWTNYLIRRSVLSLQVPSLSKESTGELVSSFGYPSLGEKIFTLSSGIPLAAKILSNAIKQIEIESNTKINREKIGDYELRLVEIIEDEYINNDLIGSLGEDLNKVLRILSVFRQFDYDTFTQFAHLIKLSFNNLWDMNYRMDLVQKFSGDGLAYWNEKNTSYSLEPSLRKILSAQTRFIDSDLYVQVCDIALKYYEDKFFKTRDIRFINEILFHKSDILRIKFKLRDIEVAQELKYILQKFLTDYIKEPGDAGKLKEIISRDEELISRIGDRREPNYFVEIIEENILRTKNVDVARLKITKPSNSTIYQISFEKSDSMPLSESLDIPYRKIESLKARLEGVSDNEDLVSLGKMIRGVFLTNRFQEMIKDISVPLTIDVQDTEIPWELLHDGTDFLSLKIPLSKRFITAEKPKSNEIRKHQRVRILIVGVSKTKVDGFKELQYVTSETNSLIARLKEIEYIDVDSLQDEEATEDAFIEKIVSGDYNIIHFSGHSGFVLGNILDSYLVLYDHKVPSSDVKRSLDGNPLVFLNTCTSGSDSHVENQIGYAGSYTIGLASAFILGGATNSIGALWNVNDQAAADFSISFYEHVLGGEMVAEAIRKTRIHIKNKYPDKLVWASYVLYGDPTTTFLFTPGKNSPKSP